MNVNKLFGEMRMSISTVFSKKSRACNIANVLVVGANQGIGYYLAERLLQLGNTVTVLDIQIHGIEILKKSIKRHSCQSSQTQESFPALRMACCRQSQILEILTLQSKMPVCALLKVSEIR